MAETTSEISQSKVNVKINLRDELAGLSREKKSQAKAEIEVFTQASMLASMDAGRSPVSGGSWKKSLSKEYKAAKKKAGKSGIADLELTGSMQNSMQFGFSGNNLEIKITDTTNKKKMFNHNTGDTLPTRQALPNTGENLKKPIMDGIKRIIKDIKSGN